MAQGAVASWAGRLVCGSHGPGAVPEPLQRSDLLSKRPESLALSPSSGNLSARPDSGPAEATR